MKQIYFSIFLLFLLSGSIRSSFAQKAWSLSECIQYAYDNNIQIKQQKINTQYQENNLQQAKFDILPDLNASGSYGASFGRALDQTTYEFTDNQTVKSSNLNLSSSVNLFRGFQNHHTILQSKYDLLSSLQDLEKLKNDISLNIAAAYLQILFNTEIRNVAMEQLQVTQQQRERTKLLVDAGSLARGSLLEMESQFASDELALINAENSLDLSYLTLTQLLDLDSTGNFAIEVPVISTINEDQLLVPVDQIYQEALDFLPQIKSAEYQYESSLEGQKIAQGSRSPRLSLTASYGTGYSDTRQQITDTQYSTQQIGTTAGGEAVFTTVPSLVYGNYPLGEQFADNASTNVFLNLSVPIFTRFQIKNSITNARLMVENAELELQYKQNQLFKEIQQAYADAVASLKKYKASGKALVSMEESFKYTREKNDVGLVNAVDFNIAQNQLIMTQSDFLQAKYDFIFKTSILNFYRGKPIKINY
jgi:outer membrane protein